MIPNFELRFLFGSEDLRAAKGYRGSPLRSCMSPRAGRNCFRTPPQADAHSPRCPRHLAPWLEEALALGGAPPGSGAARRPRRFWLRCSSWHWAPRGQRPLREKSGHSSVCFFLHCGGKRRSWGSPSRPLHPGGWPHLLCLPPPRGLRPPRPEQPALPPSMHPEQSEGRGPALPRRALGLDRRQGPGWPGGGCLARLG